MHTNPKIPRLPSYSSRFEIPGCIPGFLLSPEPRSRCGNDDVCRPSYRRGGRHQARREGASMTVELKDPQQLDRLGAELDPEMRFRPLHPAPAWLVAFLLFTLSCFHYYTAGFGLLPDQTHRGIHIAFVLGLIFLVFPTIKSRASD